jgi:hypothetical protein
MLVKKTMFPDESLFSPMVSQPLRPRVERA